MNKPTRAPLRAALMCLVCTLVAVPASSGTPWFSDFTARVLHRGHDAFLPPHLALVLGIGTGESAVAVKQLGTQSPQEIRTFNVRSEKGHTVVVIVRYDQQTRITNAYLLESGARLRTAVSYEAGAPPTPVASTAAHNALREELQYWSDRAADPALPGK